MGIDERYANVVATNIYDKVYCLTLLFAVGAPEVIKKLLKEGNCPDDYDKVSMYHMGRGQRVLAMAYRRVSLGQDIQTLKKLKREDVECDLIFAGFLLLDCPIKGDSKVRAPCNKAISVTRLIWL